MRDALLQCAWRTVRVESDRADSGAEFARRIDMGPVELLWAVGGRLPLPATCVAQGGRLPRECAASRDDGTSAANRRMGWLQAASMQTCKRG